MKKPPKRIYLVMPLGGKEWRVCPIGRTCTLPNTHHEYVRVDKPKKARKAK